MAVPTATLAVSAADLARRFHELSRELSHDVRHPVGSILGYVELLRDNPTTKLSDEQAQLLSRIKANCTIVLDLLKCFTETTGKFGEPTE